jgi:tRNA-2-methylthio-N6-dimethylallyladenosine synthase
LPDERVRLGQDGRRAAASDGLELTDSPDDADVILFNTCSIREKAQEKVFSQLGVWKGLKNKGREVIIGVGGCVASQEGEAIIKRAPFGPGVRPADPAPPAGADPRTPRAEAPAGRHQLPRDREVRPPARAARRRPSAFVSIMEGCSKYCSFCVVPYTRGTEVSRPFEDVVVEVAQLAAQGVREINLLGQNVNAYRGPMATASSPTSAC